MTLQVRRPASERGSTLVEFAIVAFLLAMMVFSVVEMERMVLVYTTVANAARVGARYAIVHGSTQSVSPSGPGNNPAAVVTVIKNFASAGLLDTSKMNITVSYSGSYAPLNSPGDIVTVKVVYPYDPFISWFNQLRLNLGTTTQGVITF